MSLYYFTVVPQFLLLFLTFAPRNFFCSWLVSTHIRLTVRTGIARVLSFLLPLNDVCHCTKQQKRSLTWQNIQQHNTTITRIDKTAAEYFQLAFEWCIRDAAQWGRGWGTTKMKQKYIETSCTADTCMDERISVRLTDKIDTQQFMILTPLHQ